MELIDTHTHLADERLLPHADAIVARAAEAGVRGIVCIATGADDVPTAISLAERFPMVWATAGIHPHDAGAATDGDFTAVAEAARHPRVVAFGETGLDYFYDHAPRATQLRLFERHLALAEEHALPVVVHSRQADEDLISLLRTSAGRLRGVLHCFAGGRALLDAALEAGWMISFAGLITFKKYDGVDLLRSVPADRILVETDAPYLTPVPFRGKPNEPALVRFTAEHAAVLRGVAPADFARTTTANARRFFRLDHAGDAH